MSDHVLTNLRQFMPYSYPSTVYHPTTNAALPAIPALQYTNAITAKSLEDTDDNGQKLSDWGGLARSATVQCIGAALRYVYNVTPFDSILTTTGGLRLADGATLDIPYELIPYFCFIPEDATSVVTVHMFR